MARFLALIASIFVLTLSIAGCEPGAPPPSENVGVSSNALSAQSQSVLSISDLYAEYNWGANGVTYSNAADRCVRAKPTSLQSDKLLTRFNLSGVGCTSIASATLLITTRDESVAAGNFNLTVRRLLRAYDPAAVGWKYASAGVQWTSPGAASVGNDVSSDAVSFHVGYGTVAHSIDVTSLVSSWFTGGPAHGLIITSPGDHAWVVQGSISLAVECAGPVPVCGDGTKAGAETCDDGNVLPGDGCSSSCSVEAGYACDPACHTVCGDGVVAGAEGCDDGNSVNTDGCAACVPAACGDGFVHVGVEQCDDGNSVNTDGCLNNCHTAICGDGVTGPGEACDDGNDNPGDSCVLCAVAFCGDGYLQMGVEECDDGNEADGDGCSGDCVAEVCSCEVP